MAAVNFERGTEKGLSPKTIKNVHGVLHRALEQAQKMGYIRNNPLTAVTLPQPRENGDEVHQLVGISANLLKKRKNP